MLNYVDVLRTLTESAWSDTSKQQLQPLLPQMGQWTLAYANKLFRDSSVAGVEAEYTSLIVSAMSIYENISTGQFQKIDQFLQATIMSGRKHQIDSVLPVLIDIRANQSISVKIPEDTSLLIDRILIERLRELPYDSVADMLQYRIHHLFSLTDLQMEIKRFCFYRQSFEYNDVENDAFRKAILYNQQFIGTSDLQMDGKSVPATVANWIQSYVNFIATTQDKTAYNIVIFLTKSPDVKKLTDYEKTALSEILKLYNWLAKPFVTSEEIALYESDRDVLGLGPEDDYENESEDFETENTEQSPVESSPFIDYNQGPDGSGATASNDSKIPLTTLADIDAIAVNPVLRKKGVVIDPSNIAVDEEADKFQKQQTDRKIEIQRKLESLKKRTHLDDGLTEVK